MRVMHLIEPWTSIGPANGTDAAVLACGASIAATPADWHEPIVIGASSGRVRSDALGIEADDGMTPPGPAPRAWQQLRATALSRGCPDVVQAWSEPTRMLAERAAIAPVVSIPLEIKAPPQVHLPQCDSRDRIRARLGVRTTVPIIAAIADPPGTVDAVRFILLLGLLQQIGVRVVGVIESSANSLARACVFARQINLTQPLVITDRPLLAQAAGMDLAVWSAHTRTPVDLWSAGVIVGACHAGGLPVSCPGPWRKAIGDPVLADRLASSTSDPSAVLRTIAPILESPGTLKKLSESVQVSAIKTHDNSAWVQSIRTSWVRAARSPAVT